MNIHSLAPWASRRLDLGAVVGLMGVSQIIGYGTIFYAYAIVAPGIVVEFGLDDATPFSILSIALLVSGLAGPFLGRQVDRHGAPRIMALGSCAVGVSYLLASIAPSWPVLAVLIVVLQVISAAVLYSASFPTLTLFGGTKARRAISQLTLIAGFASTLFWPLTGWLMGSFDWRGTFVVFAALHLVVAMPLHGLIALATPAQTQNKQVLSAEGVAIRRRFAFWMVALSFGITGMVSTAMVVHLVPILEMVTLGEHTYIVSMVVGPAMVLVRLGEAIFWAYLSPIVTTILAALCFPVAIGFLLSGLPGPVSGSLFALFYGFGHGLNVIVGGTLPLHLFGRQGYGELLGRLNAVRVLLGAGAPAAFSLAIAVWGFGVTMLTGLTIGLAAVIPLIVLGMSMPRSGAAS